MALILALSCTACGEDTEPAVTTAPAAATEAPAEATEEPAAPEETAEAEAEEPTAEPEETEEETADVSFDVDELAALFESFTGIRGTAGGSLKMCVVADSCLSYAQEKELYSLDDMSKEELKTAVKEAFGRLTKKRQKEFRKNISEDVMPMITDSFQQPDVYEGEFEDCGLKETWNKKLEDPHIQDDWAVLWEALNEVL